MKEEKITKASILKSKAKMMADRNQRFAVIEEEVEDLREELTNNLTKLSAKIRKALTS